MPKEKIVLTNEGFAQAMDGEELWINTKTDEKVTIHIRDHDLRWKLYCRTVKITIETIEE